jgi:hypothetical protein
MLHMQKVGPGPEPKKKVPALAQLFQPSASCIPAKPTNSTTFFITKNLLLPQILPLVLSKIYEKLYSSMAADGLTKALTPKAFQNFRSMMSM